MVRLLLIRHGETEYNLNKRYCGFSNPPLNAYGISQVKILAKKIRSYEVSVVYSSDLLRAKQTAQLLFPDHQIKVTPDFREYNFGIFEGLTYSEIMKSYPLLYQNWVNDPLNIRIPEGEGPGEFKKRVFDALYSVISLNKDKTVALVAHSGPIKLILCKMLGYGFEKFYELEQQNATFSVIDYLDNCIPVTVKTGGSSYFLARGNGGSGGSG
ncbi:MAG: histidine phosphatase family protein, partial [Actinomycetota bacterium]|nr:histidine phosphatase family protein [Actinomycetota bacterium]